MKTVEVPASQLIKQLSSRLKLTPVEVPHPTHSTINSFHYVEARRKCVERHLLEHLVKVKYGNDFSNYSHASSNYDLYELLNSIVDAPMRDIVKLYNKVTQDWSGKYNTSHPLSISEEGRQILIDNIVASRYVLYEQTEKERLENEDKKDKQQYVAENSQVARAIHELQQKGRTDLSLVSEYLSET